MRLTPFLLALTCAACGDDDLVRDGTPDAGDLRDASSLDARPPDSRLDAEASLDAHTVDGSPHDAASDAGVCSVDQKYELMITGGLLRYQDQLVLEGTQLTKTRTHYDGTGPQTCRVSIGCDGPTVDARELHDALTHPDVVSAFREGELVLGEDARPWDGSVLFVEREDGKQISVGADCPPGVTCTPIPERVRVLRDLLWKLSEEHGGDPAEADSTGTCPRADG
jgi:hypothetical protein